MKILKVVLSITMLFSAATCWGQDGQKPENLPASLEESSFFLSSDPIELNRMFRAQVYQAKKMSNQAKAAPLKADLQAVRDFKEELKNALALNENDYAEACQAFAARIENLENIDKRGRLAADFKRKKNTLETRREELEADLAVALDQETRLMRTLESTLYVGDVFVSSVRPLFPGLDMATEKQPVEPGLSPEETTALLAEARSVAAANNQKDREQGEKE